MENDKQTAAVTKYLVQEKRQLGVELEDGPIEAWVDLGEYEVPSGNRRKAIEMAMEDHGLEEGSFHTIPATSAMVETCHVSKRLIWQ